jgi:MFS family permease
VEWRALLDRQWLPILAVLLGGVLLQSMNVLMLTTVLPSIADELHGGALLSWPTSAFLASSIVAASCAGMLAGTIGARAAYCSGVATFGLGALLCALAPTMVWIVAGRFIQGFGGGLEVATAYVVIRRTFPENLWSRTIALVSTGWSMSVLLGPLVGGMFARFGGWRGAFVATATAAGVLAAGAFLTLRPAAPAAPTPVPRMPAGRVALICAAIAATSSASIVMSPFAKAALLVAALGALATMLRLDRVATPPLLPTDAFSWWTPTGVGLWLVLLLSITFSPLQIFVPIFLQRLHGLDPLAAGFAVASASMGWTLAALATASLPPSWQRRLIMSGPAVMGTSLMAIAWLTPDRAVTLWLIVPIVLLGIGVGQGWPLVAHRVMDGAKAGEEIVAASSFPTIQQLGFALGAAVAGLVANASGLGDSLDETGVLQAAFWVPASFIIPAALAALAARRLCSLPARRHP